jgi:pimeloyl-ACP methyl ester carboxylesterase
MPYARNQRPRIYWEEEGCGDPLLMIMGLGYSHVMWRDLRAMMARHFRVIVFDNRGCGRSSHPWWRFAISDMATDALRVLDAAAVAAAHVLGISMGGMIAQELTLRNPERVRRLVLGCTFCGGSYVTRPAPEVERLLTSTFMSRAKRIAALIPHLYDDHTPRARIDQDMDVLRKHPPRVLGVLAQVRAILNWQSYDRLPQIEAPTLVIHGESDRLIPPANGVTIAKRIPCAKLVLLPRAGHIFPSDQPQRTYEELVAFLTNSHATEGGV